MAEAAFDSSTRRHERLTQHLATEHTLRTVLRARSAENIDFDGFQVEQLYELVDGRRCCLCVGFGHEFQYASEAVSRKREGRSRPKQANGLCTPELAA
jgi:hypothetical protein